MADRTRLALLAGLGGMLVGEEVKLAKEPDFTDIRAIPTYRPGREKTHPQNPKQSKPKRKKK